MADQRVLRVYTVDGGPFEIVWTGTRFTTNPPRPASQRVDLNGITRIALFDSDAPGSPVLAFDVVPANATLSHVQVPVGGRSLFVLFLIRCAVCGDGERTAVFQLELFDGNRVRFLKVSRSIGGGTPIIQGTTARVGEIPEVWKTTPRVMGGGSGDPLEAALGIELTDNIRLSLIEWPDSSARTLAFSRFLDESDRLPFPLRLRDKERVSARTLTLHQRPRTSDLPLDPPPTTVEWDLDLRDLLDRWAFVGWNEHAVTPYLEGLHTVQSGRPMSLLPRWRKASSNGGALQTVETLKTSRWGLLGVLSEDAPVSRAISPRARLHWRFLYPIENFAAEVDFPGFRTHAGEALGATLNVEFRADEGGTVSPGGMGGATAPVPRQPPAFRFAARATAGEGTVRVGALDLAFAGTPPPDAAVFQVGFRPPGAGEFRRDLPLVEMDATFALDAVVPGAQDPVPGEEMVAEGESLLDDDLREFRRTPPVVIPVAALADGGVASPPAGGGFLLRAREITLDDASQTVTLQLVRQDPGGPPGPPDAAARPEEQVLVLDREPFLIARVELPGMLRPDPTRGPEVGNWSNRPIGGGWELTAPPGGFTLVLPPQGVGEEMERVRNVAASPPEPGKDDVGEGEPADYRFSPPARLRLLSSFFRQSFAEAPWNLRRVLGFPGQRAPGAEVRRMEFELLYGMTCVVDLGMRPVPLRLAELAARLGASPGRVPARVDAGEPGRPGAKGSWIDQWKELHQAYRTGWDAILLRQRTRLGVLEPWEAERVGTVEPISGLTLREGVLYRLRAAAQLRFPGDTSRIENPALREHADTGLAGGVAWAFESTNIYNAVWRVPTSVEAALAEPRFSALGGWGVQRASFDNRRTTIEATVAMGRTMRMATERIGRISVTWQRARHVVVYERTVRRARQFQDDQDELPGRPVLRKVREYVEILDPDQRYPEFGAAPVTRGFVEGSSFPPEGRIINVNSRWGRDVGDSGWIVPLWDPEDGRAHPEIYPRPRPLLELAADPESGAATQRCPLLEPHKLFFYTDTRPDTDSRTDIWPPVWGVDYTDVLASPEDLLAPGEELRPPDDASLADHRPPPRTVADGMGRFTFAIEPPSRLVNLAAARGEGALGAVVRNVTLMRAPALREASAEAREAIGLAAALGGITDRLDNAVEGLLDALPDAGDAQKALDAAGDAVHGARDALSRLRDDLARLGTLQADVCNELRRRAEAQLDAGVPALRGRLVPARQALREALNGLGEAEDWKARARDAVNDAFDRLRNRVEADFWEPPDLEEVQEAIRATAAAVHAPLRDVRAEVAQAASLEALRTAARARLHALSRALDQATRELDARIARATSAWAGGRLDVARAALVRFSGAVQARIAAIGAAIDRAGAELEALRGEVLRELDAADAAVQDLEDQASAAAHSVAAALHGLEAALRGAAGDVLVWPDAARAEVLRLIDELPDLPGPGTEAEVRRALGPLLDDDAFVAALREWRLSVGRRAAALCAEVVPDLGVLAGALAELDPAASLVRLLAAPPQEVTELRQALRELHGRARAVHAALAEQARGAVEAVRNRAVTAGKLVQAGDSTLRLLRAFGDAPRVPGLGFDRERAAYWFDEARKQVQTTPLVARVNEAARDAREALGALGTRVPTRELLDRLIPDGLERLSLSRVFPEFAGLKLASLFPGQRVPKAANESVKITHGTDRQSLRAWVNADVDVGLADQPATLFAVGPVTVRLRTARFQARARVEAAPGRPPAATSSGVIRGDWELGIGGTALAIFRDTALVYDDGGHLRFHVSPERVELAAALRFLSELMDAFGYSGSGLSVGMLPLPQIGVRSVLDLPIPDIQLGAFGIANLRLSSTFVLRVDGGFRMDLSLAVGRKSAPFTLTVFILGGGGWLEADASYAPSTGRVETRVTIGIAAGASLRIALGPIRGGVWVTLGIYAEFQSGAGGGLAVGIVLVIGGEVCLAGIVTVSLMLRLEARYGQDGSLVGRGMFSARIKICWCFTLEIRQEVEYVLVAGRGPQSGALAAAAADPYQEAADRYLDTFEP